LPKASVVKGEYSQAHLAPKSSRSRHVD
jgi:hypothetical protein